MIVKSRLKDVPNITALNHIFNNFANLLIWNKLTIFTIQTGNTERNKEDVVMNRGGLASVYFSM
jgi:hypothetical protein